jgi:hypothetical protein
MAKRRVGLKLISVAYVMAFVGCTSGANPTSQTTVTTEPATPTTTTAATTSTAIRTVAENLVLILADDDFSAEVELDSTQRQPGMTLESHGTGAISRPDSTLMIEHDFSALASTVISREGLLLGPQGLTSVTDESRFLEGTLYQSKNGGRWRLIGEGDTTLGHVFDRLGGASGFSDLGMVTLDDVELHHLQPITDPGFDATFWDLDPSALEDFVVLADVYADDAGMPLQVRLQIGLRDPSVGAVIWEEAYRLSHINERTAVDPPEEVWTSLSALGYESLVDMLVPVEWAVEAREKGTILLGSSDGTRLGVSTNLSASVDAETALRDFLAALGLEPVSIQETNLGIFPSAYAAIVDEPTAAYSEVRTLGLDLEGTIVPYVALGMVLYTPSGAEVQSLLEDLISTITWRNPNILNAEPSLVPGETLADNVVQSDTINLMMPRLAGDTECESPVVAHTDLVGGSRNGWAEDWYVAACDQLLVLRVDYSLVSEGGFTISVGPPTLIGE